MTHKGRVGLAALVLWFLCFATGGSMWFIWGTMAFWASFVYVGLD